MNKIFYPCLIFLWLPKIILASGSSHAINWWHMGSAYKDAPALGWLIITFIIFVYGIIKVINKPLALYLEMRSKTIKEQIEEGIRAKKEGEEKLHEYEEKLKTLDKEIENLRKHVLDQAESEKQEREKLFLEMKDRIIKEADDTIKADYIRYKNRLAEEAIKKALQEAENIIKNNRHKQDEIDQALRIKFLQDLSGIKEI
jgi:F-type H+-transporting ATPase subunit b